MVDIAYTASPIEIFGSSVALVTFVMLFILFVLSLNDQRIVIAEGPDQTNRLVASNAVINEIARTMIGLAILIVWLAAMITPPFPSSENEFTPVAVALVTMFPFMQFILLMWGIKDLIVRRRLLHTQDHGQPQDLI